MRNDELLKKGFNSAFIFPHSVLFFNPGDRLVADAPI